MNWDHGCNYLTLPLRKHNQCHCIHHNDIAQSRFSFSTMQTPRINNASLHNWADLVYCFICFQLNRRQYVGKGNGMNLCAQKRNFKLLFWQRTLLIPVWWKDLTKDFLMSKRYWLDWSQGTFFISVPQVCSFSCTHYLVFYYWNMITNYTNVKNSTS